MYNLYFKRNFKIFSLLSVIDIFPIIFLTGLRSFYTISLEKRKSDKTRKRNLWGLFITGMIHGFGVSMFNIAYQPYMLGIAGSIFYVGFFITLSGVMQFAPMPIIGKIADRFGFRNTMLFAVPFYIIGIIFLIFAEMGGIALLTIGIIFIFLGFTILNLNNQMLTAESKNGLTTESGDKSKSGLGLTYGLMFFSFFGGSIGGSIFVGIGNYEPQFYFQIFMGVLLAEWIIQIFLMKDEKRVRKKNQFDRSELKEESIWRIIFNNPKIKIPIIFFTLDIFVWGISLGVYFIGLIDFYKISMEELGVLTMWFYISNMIFQIPAGHLADKIGRKKSLYISLASGFIFFSLNLLAYFLWSSGIVATLFPLLIAGLILWGVSVSTFIPSEQMTLTNLNKTKKAESYGVVSFIRGIGMLPTGIIGGFLVDFVHYTAPFFVTMVGIIVEIWFLMKWGKEF